VGSSYFPETIDALSADHIHFLGWFFIPDLPTYRSAWYLTTDEKEHAAKR
jgi:hypothetical protein